MASKLTNTIVESYFECKYKAYLRFGGESGEICDYEHLQTEARKVAQTTLAEKVLSQHALSDVLQDALLSASLLKNGAKFLLNARLETDELRLRFDGLKRISAQSKLGNFCFIPVLVPPKQWKRRDQKLLLAIHANCLADLQGTLPTKGIIFQSPQFRSTSISLASVFSAAKQLRQELTETVISDSPPSLLLNNHCDICEFSKRCHEQAVKEGNISLLRGMGEKEITRHARKGIITLNRLSLTFRPRRKGKRQGIVNRRYHALQAMAVRDHTVYVLGPPEVRTSRVNVYVDIESVPEEDFVYLIGAIIEQEGFEDTLSFWANNKVGEAEIFQQFLDALDKFDDFTVFAYGSFEKSFFTKMRNQAKGKKRADRLLKSLVNTLSLVYSHVHVAHRTSMAILATMTKEFFGLQISDTEILTIKSLMARYCRKTYNNMLKKMLSGVVIHSDETYVTLRSGKGYVWVFASLEEVVFMYRPNREGEFVQKMLKGFDGVLVSDFYVAYDSLNCAQQKCLIHLMRDMNQELLNNPFDAELQSVTQPFGSLLRSVVETIDEHGLKRRHLKMHDRAITRFFMNLDSQTFRSEVAANLQERLLRNRNKLFTFVQHDGVSWNNNSAENAIKQFAYYRHKTKALLTENGISDYLVLLSICQSCRYKGVSFFKFLLSKERDIDAFCQGGRKKRRARIEVYPKGLIPPHLASLRKTTGN